MSGQYYYGRGWFTVTGHVMGLIEVGTLEQDAIHRGFIETRLV